jgi:hypothetical protein
MIGSRANTKNFGHHVCLENNPLLTNFELMKSRGCVLCDIVNQLIRDIERGNIEKRSECTMIFNYGSLCWIKPISN